MIGIPDLLKQHSTPHKIDFKVEVPCPMKNRFQAAFDQFERDHLMATGERFYSFVPNACGEHVDGTGTIRDLAAMTDPDQLPDICIDFASGPFGSPAMVDRFVSKGVFDKVIDVSNTPFLIAADRFTDSYGAYNILALNPEVMLVDTRALNGRPAPHSFEDILDPMWESSVCLPDNHQTIGTRLPTAVWQRFGEDGLAALERNACTAMNGPTVARSAGHGTPQAAVYMIPWVFARGAARPGRVDLVWPEDGANCNPVILMVKRDRAEKNNALLDFVLSDTMAQVFADNQIPSTRPGTDNGMPEGAKVRWLGWDHVLSGIQPTLDAEFGLRFARFHHQNSC
ncbi:ABC transporter substrate-binding protein [Propionibacterium sp.]|uniref:ABC transporter substrate-binding protein n=1 Tax=Propionibacterium sp. TaxID=1977903 RepID=UPI0039E9FD00